MRKMLTTTIGAVVLAALATTGSAQTTVPRIPEPPQVPPPHGMAAADSGSSAPMDRCKAMMADHEAMMERMKASDEELGRLMEEVSSSKGEARLQAMEQVLRTLVDERHDMHTMMEGASRMPMMKGKMAAMPDCPMMGGAGAGGDADPHAAHHPAP